MVWNAHRAWAEVMRIFTEVRGIGILRTSPFGHSANFAYTEFSEVRHPQATPKQPQR
jgi:hypothetical protein